MIPENDAEMIAEDERGAEHCYGTDGTWDSDILPRTREFFGNAVLKRDLGSGLEFVDLFDAEGNPVNENAAKKGGRRKRKPGAR